MHGSRTVADLPRGCVLGVLRGFTRGVDQRTWCGGATEPNLDAAVEGRWCDSGDQRGEGGRALGWSYTTEKNVGDMGYFWHEHREKNVVFFVNFVFGACETPSHDIEQVNIVNWWKMIDTPAAEGVLEKDREPLIHHELSMAHWTPQTTRVSDGFLVGCPSQNPQGWHRWHLGRSHAKWTSGLFFWDGGRMWQDCHILPRRDLWSWCTVVTVVFVSKWGIPGIPNKCILDLVWTSRGS